MIIIKGNRIEYMVKEYRQKSNKIGLINELKDRREYKKKSARKREQRKNAIYKNKLNGNR